MPFGMHPETSPLCAPFRRPDLVSIAVVGNGPISDAQRRYLATFDVIVRRAAYFFVGISISRQVCHHAIQRSSYLCLCIGSG